MLIKYRASLILQRLKSSRSHDNNKRRSHQHKWIIEYNQIVLHNNSLTKPAVGMTLRAYIVYYYHSLGSGASSDYGQDKGSSLRNKKAK